MKGILLRVGADQTEAGGRWNAPVDTESWRYAYVPIAADEQQRRHIAPCPTYAAFAEQVAALRVSLPPHLNGTTCTSIPTLTPSRTASPTWRRTAGALPAGG